jgi:hypothetical protein
MTPGIQPVGYIDLNIMRLDHRRTYHELMQLRRPRFESHEKILVNNTDQDFYYHDCRVGFLLHNFLTMVYHADISLSNLVFFTLNNQLMQSIEPFVTHEHDRPEVHTILVSRITHAHIKPMLDPQAVMPKDLQHVGLCMMGTPREHRTLLMQYLMGHDLLDQVQTCMASPDNPVRSEPPVLSDDVPCYSDFDQLNLVFSQPPFTIESWAKPLTNERLKDIVLMPAVQQYINPVIPRTGFDFYRHYAVDIVTETNFHYPGQFVTEKTLRPLLMRTPFVMFGSQHFLANLHDRGFATFGDIWDESYDSIADPQQRFVQCCEVIKHIASWPLDHWRHIYRKISDRLDHNRERLLQYINNELLPLAKRYQYPLP